MSTRFAVWHFSASFYCFSLISIYQIKYCTIRLLEQNKTETKFNSIQMTNWIWYAQANAKIDKMSTRLCIICSNVDLSFTKSERQPKSKNRQTSTSHRSRHIIHTERLCVNWVCGKKKNMWRNDIISNDWLKCLLHEYPIRIRRTSQNVKTHLNAPQKIRTKLNFEINIVDSNDKRKIEIEKKCYKRYIPCCVRSCVWNLASICISRRSFSSIFCKFYVWNRTD